MSICCCPPAVHPLLIGCDRTLATGWQKQISSEKTADEWPSLRRATEMDITMIGLQNAGKTSLLRVLAVSPANNP